LHAWLNPELPPFSFLGGSSYLLNCDDKISTQISVLKRKKGGAEAPPRVWGGVQERGENGSAIHRPHGKQNAPAHSDGH
jgi:hypothetical protein